MESRMKKIRIFAAILMLLASNTLASDLRISGEKISLYAKDEPLQGILRQMARQGISVKIDPQLNPVVSAAFENSDIQKVIDAIVRPYDHVLIWEKPPQKPSGFTLSEIRIFTTGKQDRMRELVSPRAFSLSKSSKNGAVFVKDEILLRAKSRAAADKIVRAIAGTITDTHEALGIYKVRLPADSDVPAISDKISSLGGEQARPDFAYGIPRSYTSDASLPAEIAKTFRADGKVPVAVLDSGLSPGIGPDGFVMASFDAVNSEPLLSDALGHGTQMALIASGTVKPFGVATENNSQVPLIAIRAMDDNGVTTDFTILKSIDFAMEKGARVMSLSWGSETRSDFLENTLDYAASKGMIIVASAGNEPTGNPVYPAAYSSVIGVGAAYPDGKIWEKSNYGSFVDVSAPGFAAFPVGSGGPGVYAGTSISAAFTANLIANYLSKYPESSSAEIKAELIK